MKRGAIILALSIVAVSIALMLFSFISAMTTFQANSVSIKIDGTDTTLQSASDNSLLIGTHSYASVNVTNLMGQHDASQIWISVKDGETTLLNALSDSSNFPSKLCANPSRPLTYSNSAPNPGHYATEVILSSGKSLQQAINDGDYCAASWSIGNWSSNNACPTTTFTRTVYCRDPNGNNLGTTCGIYRGCNCPMPSATTTTTCVWIHVSTDCHEGVGCYSSGYSCSAPSGACGPAGATYDFLDNTCACSWTGGCSGYNDNVYRCYITNPA